jgi:sugar/nucleoside kinase (ribokinase family)
MTPLVVGTLALDTIDWPDGRVDGSFGGSGLFSSLAASLTGPVGLVAAVGGDFPPAFRALLESRGVDLAGLAVHPGQKMFRWHGRYHDDLNRRETVGLELNVIAATEPTLPPSVRGADIVLIANMPPAKQLHVLDQLTAPRFVLADTVDDWIIAHRDELIRVFDRVDAVLMNDSEAKLLAEDDQLIRAARRVRTLGARTLIVKKGEHGCLLFDDAGIALVPAFPTDLVVDPTGAGDAFAGGVVGWLASACATGPADLRRAALHGSVLASFAVEAVGADRLGSLTADELAERTAQFRDMMTFQ